VLRVVLPPLAAAYAAFVVMVVVARRRPVARPRGRDRSFGPSGRTRASVVGTVVGDYVAFPVIVLVFRVWIAGERDVLWSAAWGGAFLCSLALAIWGGSVAHRTGNRSTPVIRASARASLVLRVDSIRLRHVLLRAKGTQTPARPRSLRVQAIDASLVGVDVP
jgi:hypothetical protein